MAADRHHRAGHGSLAAAVFGGGFLYVRRRTAARSAHGGGLLGSAELPPQSAIATTGYPILPLVLHPRPRKSLLLVWLIALPLGIAFDFVYFTQLGGLVRWTIGAGLALLVLGGVVWQFVLLPRSAIYVDDLTFGTVSGLGRRKSWARDEAARVVLSSGSSHR